MSKRLVPLLFLAAVPTFAALPADPLQPTEPSAVIQANYGNLPLSFEANQGQADPQVQFLSRGSGYSLFLTDSGAVLALGEASACKSSPAAKAAPCSTGKSDVVRMTLLNHAGQSRPGHATPAAGEQQLPGKVNYFLGNDPTRWRSNLSTYARVRYSQVYSGIDLVYYGNQRQLEYDFVVAPGANPESILLRFEGQRHLRIAANGDLILQGEAGSAAFHKPVIYQEKGGHRQTVAGSFELAANDTVRFRLGHYDRTRQLIIDPVLVYSTYLGGSGAATHGDQGNGIAIDSTGHAYIVGTTFSSDFPVSSVTFQSHNYAPPRSTVFVTRLGLTGTSILNSTYLGGTGGDFGYGIALDSANNAYVTGATYSRDFPVTCGAFQVTNPSTTTGAPTAFVTKLDFHGTELVYSTYLGGSGNGATTVQGDVSQAIAVDTHGNAYVTGYTFSSNFPVTDQAFQQRFAGSATVSSAFVTKLNATGTALSYSTYLGGAGSNGAGDVGNAIVLDSVGDAFVAGSTGSTDFPVTSAPIQPPTQPIAFVTKVSASGSNVLYSRFLGGSGGDSAQAIAVDTGGFAYVAGNTDSTDFPLTSGVFEGSENSIAPYLGINGAGAFVTKVSADGESLVYSTMLEGQSTLITGLALDSAGNTYITGTAPTLGAGSFGGFVSTPDALPVPAITATAAFLVKLDPAAVTLQYATFLGGSSNDSAKSVAIDQSGNAFVTGAAYSSNFPVTTSALQKKKAKGAVSDAFVTKFALAAAANSTGYPAAPTHIGTKLIGSGFLDVYCDFNEWDVYVSVVLQTDAFGPPPTGTYELDLDTGFGEPTDLTYSYWGGGDSWSASTHSIDPPYGGTFSVDWGSFYSGDSIYDYASATGSVTANGCPEPTFPAVRGTSPSVAQVRSTPPASGSQRPAQYGYDAKTRTWQPTAAAKAAAAASRANALQPRFTPPPALDQSALQNSSLALSPEVQGAQAACIVPKIPSLTITVNSASRVYRAANPVFTYSQVGLASGDSITVTYQTTATTASPVGTYPVTATVSGPAASKYNIFVVDSTLTVTPAPLTVTILPAANSRVYGKPNAAGFLTNQIGFDNNFDASSFYLNGAAAVPSTTLQVKQNGFNEFGSAYAKTQVSLAPFTTEFTFQLGSPNSGMTFILQSQGPTALGGLLGYSVGANSPIQPSVAIKFDTYYWNNVSPSTTGLYLNGATPVTDGIDVTAAGIDLRSQDVFRVLLRYDGQNLTETLTDTATNATFTHTYSSLNLAQILGGNTAYAGFTADNGFNGSPVSVDSWSFATLQPAPTSLYTVSGLRSGEIISVALSTTATAKSPVGSYPISAIVTGATVSNYAVTVLGASLQVKPAMLTVTATSHTSTYGQTPPPLVGFTLAGFVNGDTASVVSGTPALFTTVTATTPAGYYPIQTAVGTLTAANYTIIPFAQKGVLHVEKAFLTAKADNLVIHQNSPIPPFTYTLTGFVNGDTPASSVTGTALMRTDAGSQTRPGAYPIYMNRGTLYSPNYSFTPVNGTLTILP